MMGNKKIFSFLSCLLVGASFLTTMAHSAEKPNILLIISDDQGYGDFGFMGNTVLRTPQLDKLAASGAIFENYTTGVACSPGRSMIFSGRNNLLTGAWGVGARFGLRSNETLMPMFFRENGYSTFYFDSASRIQSHSGDIRVIPKLTGFAKEGDSVTYTIDSAAAGTYAIHFTGTFAGAAPLRVEVAGKPLPQKELKGNKLLCHKQSYH